RQVGIGGRRVRCVGLVGLDRVDEVAEMGAVFAAGEALDQLALRRERDRAAVGRDDEHALRALEDIADQHAGALVLVRRVFAGGQAAHFEDHLGVAVVLDRDLGVGGLAVV